jgi:NAD(P)-dependent dehydrogenase (short-subunit alcohol dehydrogenase family)
MKDLDGKIAVVTGAASGIGRAIAEKFLAQRMKVVLADIEPEQLQQTERELSQQGVVAAVHTDVARAEDVQALADTARETFGAVHVLCNNAGVGMGGALWEHSLRDWEWLFGVNVWGVVHGIRAFVPIMLAQGDECHIVNTASAAGLDARAWLGMYSASKYAVVAMSESLREELRMTGAKIGVSVVCPAVVNTRIGDAERNRPEVLQNDADIAPPAQAQAFGEAFRAMLAHGLPPEQIADAVIEAIKSRRFYVIPQAETETRIRARFERMLSDVREAPA